ncbi:unnamed protein product [Orchesella dallaii]|uniref:Uncharacterized protein n=1 Tax=Orchesella dallaii TaxID=48710 RepID=A0ABP1R421_9HEXA
MIRLRNDPLQLEFKFLQDFGAHVQKLYIHHIQSFKKHMSDLLQDGCAMAADFIGLVEPHLLIEDDLEIPILRILHPFNCTSRRNSEGVLLLGCLFDFFSALFSAFCSCTIKAYSELTLLTVKRNLLNNPIVFLKFRTEVLPIFIIYKHPRYLQSRFEEILDSELKALEGGAVVTGDINIDLMHGNNNSFMTFSNDMGSILN